MNQELATLRAN